MTPEQLKASIFQCALQGKLVEQRGEEGSVEVLYQSLLDAKENLVKKKKILKKANTVPFYEEEYPFDIPETWKWVQLSDVSIIQEGAGIRKFQYRDSGTQILCVTNILDGSIDLEKKKLYIDTDEYKKKYIHLTLNKGDIVTSCSGGSWGKISFFNEDKTLMLNTSTLRMRFFNDLADNEYLYYVCQSSLFKNQLTEQLSGMQPNFGYAHYSRICFPLPPLEEQHRIVEQLKKTLPFIMRYSEAYEKLERFNANFPEDMKNSILQYAIQGKLVEQRLAEGTADELYQRIQEERKKYRIKELPIDEIEETPFDIPETWKWVHLQDVVKKTIKRGKSPKYAEKSGVQVFAQKCNVKSGGINMEVALYLNPSSIEKYPNEEYMCDGDIIINSTGGGTMGRVGIFHDSDRIDEMPIVPDSHVTVIRACDEIEYKYLYYFIKHNQKYLETQGEGSTNQTELKPVTIASLVLPLPPREEQCRIVARIEELFPLCEKLVKNNE